MTPQVPKQWSFTTGERGRNRVRAFAHPETGRMFLEFREAGRRNRVALGHRDPEAAKSAAERAASALREHKIQPAGALKLITLFDIYVREVSPQKCRSAQNHDKRAARNFCECWGAQRDVSTLSRRDWDNFITWRKARGNRSLGKNGKPRGGPLRNRIIVQDLKALRTMLRWATQSGNGDGGRLLDRNPLDGIPYPKETSVRRPVLTTESYEAMLAQAPRVDLLCPLLLVVVHETGHRIGAVLGLRWSDLDLKAARARWRAENDKMRSEHETPLSRSVVERLRDSRRERALFGDGFVFPAPNDPSVQMSRHLARAWWLRAEQLAGVPPELGRGWHSLRRKFATELKHTPLKDLAHLGGWRSPQTILKCYQMPDEATLRSALADRGSLMKPGLVPSQRTPRTDTTAAFRRKN